MLRSERCLSQRSELKNKPSKGEAWFRMTCRARPGCGVGGWAAAWHVDWLNQELVQFNLRLDRFLEKDAPRWSLHIAILSKAVPVGSVRETSSLCYTDVFTPSGCGPEGRLHCILGHEGSRRDRWPTQSAPASLLTHRTTASRFADYALAASIVPRLA